MPTLSKTDGPTVAILCIGEDAQLLETRALLLRSTGAEVHCSTSDQILQSQLQFSVQSSEQRSYDLVVLCHTIEQAKARSITECAHRRVPPLQVLLLKPISTTRRERIGIDVDAVVIVEPASLLNVVTQLLSSISVA
jgi:hypothetical protein